VILAAAAVALAALPAGAQTTPAGQSKSRMKWTRPKGLAAPREAAGNRRASASEPIADEDATEAEASRLRPTHEPKLQPSPSIKIKSTPDAEAEEAAAEPSEPEQSDESSSGEPSPREAGPREANPRATPSAPAGDGMQILAEATRKSKTAADEAAYSEVIEQCTAALDAGLRPELRAHAARLEAWARNRRGEVWAEAGKAQESLAEFDLAVKLDPTRWRAVHNRGVSLAEMGQYEEAIRDFDRTIKLNPKYATAWFNRGELRYEQGDVRGSLDDYNAALRINPADAAALNSRGHAYYRLDRFRDAVNDYSEAIRLDGKNAAAYTNRGDLYADVGMFEDAARDYRTAIEINPELGRAYQSAAWLMATCPDERYRDARQALASAEKAIQIDGEADAFYLETLAAAQANAGKFDDAAATQRKALEAALGEHKSRAQKKLSQYERRVAYRESPRRVAQAQLPPSGSQRIAGRAPDRRPSRVGGSPARSKR
jgi:tetratricopeptide (TPR) repeat protein